MKRAYLAGFEKPPSAMRTATVVGAAGLAAALSLAAPGAQAKPFNVTTYHYDSLRTGWNDDETVLTPANVKSPGFGWLFSVPLDDQVDAQPLLVAGQTIAGKGTHDVVYVATESNTIYAIDAATGTVLLSKSLGDPVLQRQLPGSGGIACDNNGPNVGINSTPVIDLASKTMYVIAYTRKNGDLFGYYLHALDLSNLTDRVPAKEVAASHKLSNGKTFDFNAHFQRQRPALVESKGNIYAGFGSFCDYRPDVSRGWLLGWKTGSLTPLPAAQLNDRVATSPSSFFLSSIWMSGYGVAADATGDLFFATGNSDDKGGTVNTYNPPENIQESVVKMSGDLTTIVDYFTAGDVSSTRDYHQRDKNDEDLGAGGVLLLPDQPGRFKHLAAAAGKGGPVYLLNRDNLGKYNAVSDKAVAEADAGICWCGPSYFRGSDGVGRLVTSGGNTVMVWKVQTSPATTLVQESTSSALPSGQDPGFFTTVSSHGTAAGTAIVWAIARPTTIPGDLTLIAIDAQNGSTIYHHAAGTWNDGNANANIVPVVANGRVYVASRKELAVFGLNGHERREPQFVAEVAPVTPGQPNQVFGVVTKVEGSLITLRTRTGSEVRVDTTAADKANLSAAAPLGRALHAAGTIDSAGVMHAEAIMRVKDSPAFWAADR
jgi:outer membrane protein assembly factor BamB